MAYHKTLISSLQDREGRKADEHAISHRKDDKAMGLGQVARIGLAMGRSGASVVNR